jgi:Flp pilus assembly pilin Flp
MGPTSTTRATRRVVRRDGEVGSLITEYGLLAIVVATVAAAVIQWASGGAIVTLFDALLVQARDIVRP